MKPYTPPRITAEGSVRALTRLDAMAPDEEVGSLLLPGDPGTTT